MSAKKTYHVSIDVCQTHEYTVESVNSPEEAEEVATEWFEEGEMGVVDSTEFLGVDSYPVENEEDI